MVITLYVLNYILVYLQFTPWCTFRWIPAPRFVFTHIILWLFYSNTSDWTICTLYRYSSYQDNNLFFSSGFPLSYSLAIPHVRFLFTFLSLPHPVHLRWQPDLTIYYRAVWIYVLSSCWRQDLRTLTALLALFKEKPPVISGKKAGNVEPWSFVVFCLHVFLDKSCWRKNGVPVDLYI